MDDSVQAPASNPLISQDGIGVDRSPYAMVASQVAAPVLDVMARMPEFSKFKIHRNDLCPCRSGKKFKQCCMQNIKPAPSRLARVKQSKPSKKMEARREALLQQDIQRIVKEQQAEVEAQRAASEQESAIDGLKENETQTR